MEKNPKFRDEFADTTVLALAARWQTPENIDRFLKLMETSHPNWICDRLDHLPKQTSVVADTLEHGYQKLHKTVSQFIPIS